MYISKIGPRLYTTGDNFVAFLPFKVLVYGEIGTQTFTADICEYADLGRCFPDIETIRERAELHRVWEVDKVRSIGSIFSFSSSIIPVNVKSEILTILEKCDCAYPVFMRKLKSNPNIPIEVQKILPEVIMPIPDPQFVKTTFYFNDFIGEFKETSF